MVSRRSTVTRRMQPVPERPRPTLVVVEQLRRRVPGGIGAHARGLLGGLTGLKREGEPIDLTLLASRAPHDEHEDGLRDLGWPLQVSALPGRLLTRAWDHRLIHAPASFDLVHSVSMAAPFPSRTRGGRLVLTVHDLAWRRHPEATTTRGARWHEAALARARKSAAQIVVPSRFVAADLAAAGVEESRITVVPSGADHLPTPDGVGTDALFARLGIREPYLLSVGTLEPRKNLARLVRAYGAVRASLPGAWPLVVVGPTGWGDQGVSAGTEGVIFTGVVPDAVLAELYVRARAFAYVPLTEGAGLPPLEAMRAGTPALVAKEVPSVDDLDASGPSPALLVDPLDVDDIAAGLVSVLTDEAVRADLSARGSPYARERTWRRAALDHLALWRSLP
jgi:glycosyltransferase involved in cell wall biosynthesis